MKIYELKQKGIQILRDKNIKEAEEKAKILLIHILNIELNEYILKQNEEIEEEIKNRYLRDIIKISEGIPLEYIIGYTYFMGRKYIVNKDVLIPRLDTEILVLAAIEYIKKYNLRKVLEIGTGSGIITTTLIKETNVKVKAVDISEEALNIAKTNAELNSVYEDKVEFIQSDIYSNINEKFDLIISNPPYISEDEMKILDTDVKNEPALALYGGLDGLLIYKRIIKEAYKYIEGKEGYLMFEIGAKQKEAVSKLLLDNGWEIADIKKDFEERDRTIIAKYKRGNNE